jgi:hypothetical protein
MGTVMEPAEDVANKATEHEFHAEAHAFSGKLEKPIEHKIDPQAQASLNDYRGGHFSRVVDDINVDGLIFFKTGYSRVSGVKSKKRKGWITVSTSVIEELNVFEVVTADRIVSQASTDHSYTDHDYKQGHYPSVTFIGTQFANLRVSGFRVELEFDYGICGDKPSDDRSYLDDQGFLDRVLKQTESIATAEGLPGDLKTEYDKRVAAIKDLRAGNRDGDHPHLTCSLVTKIGDIPLPGVRAFGHILVIPEFGNVSLGEIEVGEKKYEPQEKYAKRQEPLRGIEDEERPQPSNYFRISAIQFKLGCIGHGEVTGPVAMVNGTHKP